MRYNTELEQAQRVLSTRVEEASLQARHAALEADMNRCWADDWTCGAMGEIEVKMVEKHQQYDYIIYYRRNFRN